MTETEDLAQAAPDTEEKDDVWAQAKARAAARRPGAPVMGKAPVPLLKSFDAETLRLALLFVARFRLGSPFLTDGDERLDFPMTPYLKTKGKYLDELFSLTHCQTWAERFCAVGATSETGYAVATTMSEDVSLNAMLLSKAINVWGLKSATFYEESSRWRAILREAPETPRVWYDDFGREAIRIETVKSTIFFGFVPGLGFAQTLSWASPLFDATSGAALSMTLVDAGLTTPDMAGVVKSQTVSGSLRFDNEAPGIVWMRRFLKDVLKRTRLEIYTGGVTQSECAHFLAGRKTTSQRKYWRSRVSEQGRAKNTPSGAYDVLEPESWPSAG